MPTTKLYTNDGTEFKYKINQSSEEERESPDYVYVDLAIINHRTDRTMFESNPFCQFAEKSNTPIIANPSNYKLAVKNFSLDGVTKNLPILHFFTNTSSTTQGIYSVTLECDINGTTYTQQQYLTFVPQRDDLQQPLQTSVGDQFYQVYSIQHMIRMFNDALSNGFATLRNTLVSNNENPQIGTNERPFLAYDSISNLISCYATVSGFGNQNQLSERWRLYLNQSSYNMLSNLPWKYKGLDQGRDFEIIMDTEGDRNIVSVDRSAIGGHSASPYYQISQEFQALGSDWSPVQSIVVESQNMNIYPAIQTAPVEYGNSIIGPQGQSARDHAQNIITEFSIDKTSPCAWQQNLEFYASEFTFLTVYSTDHKPLREIRVKFYYRDRFSNDLVPLDMPNHSTANLGLIFQKRTVEER